MWTILQNSKSDERNCLRNNEDDRDKYETQSNDNLAVRLEKQTKSTDKPLRIPRTLRITPHSTDGA